MKKMSPVLRKKRGFSYPYIYNKRKEKCGFDGKFDEIMNDLKTNGKSSFFWKKTLDNKGIIW